MGRGFSEILSGEVWRLVTPIFLHGNGLHLGFNMLWLYQLGRQIELFQGSRLLFLQVVLFAVICNTSQYLVSGPAFLGMSGVVYGLLGYIWMMARYDIKHRYELNSQTIMIMVIWMVICLVGIIPNVANTQHVMGFISGTLWGFFASGGIKQELRRRKFRSRL
jgi:GlpG protein